MKRVYVTGISEGRCKVCKRRRDLRCGACFECADKVSGAPIPGGHRLWETANPDNVWFYIEDKKQG